MPGGFAALPDPVLALLLSCLCPHDLAKLGSTCSFLCQQCLSLEANELWAAAHVKVFEKPAQRGPFDSALSLYELFVRKAKRRLYKVTPRSTALATAPDDPAALSRSVPADSMPVVGPAELAAAEAAASGPGALRFVHVTRNGLVIGTTDQGFGSAWNVPPSSAIGARKGASQSALKSGLCVDVFAKAIGAKARMDAKQKYAGSRARSSNSLVFFKVQAVNAAASRTTGISALSRSGSDTAAANTHKASDLEFWGVPPTESVEALPLLEAEVSNLRHPPASSASSITGSDGEAVSSAGEDVAGTLAIASDEHRLRRAYMSTAERIVDEWDCLERDKRDNDRSRSAADRGSVKHNRSHRGTGADGTSTGSGSPIVVELPLPPTLRLGADTTGANISTLDDIDDDGGAGGDPCGCSPDSSVTGGRSTRSDSVKRGKGSGRSKWSDADRARLEAKQSRLEAKRIAQQVAAVSRRSSAAGATASEAPTCADPPIFGAASSISFHGDSVCDSTNSTKVPPSAPDDGLGLCVSFTNTAPSASIDLHGLPPAPSRVNFTALDSSSEGDVSSEGEIGLGFVDTASTARIRDLGTSGVQSTSKPAESSRSARQNAADLKAERQERRASRRLHHTKPTLPVDAADTFAGAKDASEVPTNLPVRHHSGKSPLLQSAELQITPFQSGTSARKMSGSDGEKSPVPSSRRQVQLTPTSRPLPHAAERGTKSPPTVGKSTSGTKVSPGLKANDGRMSPDAAYSSTSPFLSAGRLSVLSKPMGSRLRSDIWFGAQWVRHEGGDVKLMTPQKPLDSVTDLNAAGGSTMVDATDGRSSYPHWRRLHRPRTSSKGQRHGQAATLHAIAVFQDGALAAMALQPISSKREDTAVCPSGRLPWPGICTSDAKLPGAGNISPANPDAAITDYQSELRRVCDALHVPTATVSTSSFGTATTASIQIDRSHLGVPWRLSNITWLLRPQGEDRDRCTAVSVCKGRIVCPVIEGSTMALCIVPDVEPDVIVAACGRVVCVWAYSSVKVPSLADAATSVSSTEQYHTDGRTMAVPPLTSASSSSKKALRRAQVAGASAIPAAFSAAAAVPESAIPATEDALLPFLSLQPVSVLRAHSHMVSAVATHRNAAGADAGCDAVIVASGDIGGEIVLWSASDARKIASLWLLRRGAKEGVSCLSVDSLYVVAGGSEGTVAIWRRRFPPGPTTASAAPPAELPPELHLREVRVHSIVRMIVTPSSSRSSRCRVGGVLTGGGEGDVRLWLCPRLPRKADAGPVGTPLKRADSEASPYPLPPSLAAAAATSSTRDAALHTAVCKLLKGHSARITGLHLDNNKIVTASLDGSIKLWDLQEPHVGRLLQTVRIACEVSGLGCFGDLVVAGAVDGRAWLYDFGAVPAAAAAAACCGSLHGAVSSSLHLAAAQHSASEAARLSHGSIFAETGSAGRSPTSSLFAILGEGISRRPLGSSSISTMRAPAPPAQQDDSAAGYNRGREWEPTSDRAIAAAAGAGGSRAAAPSETNLDALFAADLQAAFDIGLADI